MYTQVAQKWLAQARLLTVIQREFLKEHAEVLPKFAPATEGADPAMSGL